MPKKLPNVFTTAKSRLLFITRPHNEHNIRITTFEDSKAQLP